MMIQLHNGGVVWQDGAVHPAPAGGEAARDKTMAYQHPPRATTPAAATGCCT